MKETMRLQNEEQERQWSERQKEERMREEKEIDQWKEKARLECEEKDKEQRMKQNGDEPNEENHEIGEGKTGEETRKSNERTANDTPTDSVFTDPDQDRTRPSPDCLKSLLSALL